MDSERTKVHKEPSRTSTKCSRSGSESSSAWERAGKSWHRYGAREIPTSYGFDIRLNNKEDLDEQVGELAAALRTGTPAEQAEEFADVLAEAQALGYAEADPGIDVDGIDAAHKLTIIGSIAFGIPLQFDKTYIEGITRIEPQDVAYAGELGYRIKHLGITRKTEQGVEMRVHPTLIPERRLIANVDGVMNAVLVKGDAVGSTLYYGAGAGSEPTASAVVADVVWPGVSVAAFVVYAPALWFRSRYPGPATVAVATPCCPAPVSAMTRCLPMRLASAQAT